MLSGEYYEGDQIVEGAEFVGWHPVETSWAFYKFTGDAWGDRGLACFVTVDVEHAKENYQR
jgi:hypothetical protein